MTVRGPGVASIAHPRTASRALLAWHAAQGRPLPIRRADDPWAILVAEVMSQQTRIDRVGGHWERFVAAYPTPAALAAAPLRDVLRAWSGLGYNRRAAALRDAAIAFGAPVAAVDVNVRRLVERLAGRPMPVRELQAEADRLVDARRPADWTHAAMDVAATVCRRRAPACVTCPLARWCASRDTPGEEPRPRRASEPFHETRRWLRGRLLAEIAAMDGDAWHAIDGGRGSHDAAAVREALTGLAADGLVEVDAEGRARVP